MTACIVRFAPSPSGYLHMGNTRTALMNLLVAQKLHGSFLLRIDDTDTTRVKPEYTLALKEDLIWLGFSWDLEFNQASRLEIYRSFLKQLQDSGRVYECFETKEELEYKKKLQFLQGKPPIYDRSMLNLDSTTKNTYLAEGRKPYYRFKIDHKDTIWCDLLKGDIRFQGIHLSDPVIIREDGTFLYILTSVIDDIEKGITHIIRGEDHIVNTAIQIQMFEFFKAPLPQFGHLSLITTLSGEGFSKRFGSLSIRDLKTQGVHPMAINNYLFMLGIGEKNLLYPNLTAITQAFDLNLYSKATAKFNDTKLWQINKHILQNLSFKEVLPLLNNSNVSKITQELWEATKNNLNKLTDLNTWVKVCYEEISTTTTNQELIKLALEILPIENFWDNNIWHTWINLIKTKTSLTGKELFIPLRLAITGVSSGPELKNLLPLIGYTRTKNRLTALIT